MAKTIAVSESLSPVKRALSEAGFSVVNLESDARISQKTMESYDAVVVAGLDENLMGMQDISGRAPVINATGKTPQEIMAELEQRMI